MNAEMNSATNHARGATDDPQELRNALENCDLLSQGATQGIGAMAKAAKRMLSMDAHSLDCVSQLLAEIELRAAQLSNNISCEAGVFGANFVDDGEDSRRFREQHRALQSGTGSAH